MVDTDLTRGLTGVVDAAGPSLTHVRGRREERTTGAKTERCYTAGINADVSEKSIMATSPMSPVRVVGQTE